MMIQKHKIVGIVISVILGMILAACGKAPTVEPVRIEFSFPDEDVDFYTRLADEFHKKHPHTTVLLNPALAPGFWAVQPASSDAFAIGTDRLKTYLDRGGLLALDPFIQTDRSFSSSDYYHGMLDLLQVDDQTWAVPLGVDMFVLFYNKDVFEQAGIELPHAGWTWDDFLNAAISLTNPDNPDHPVYGYTTTPGYSDTFAFIYAHGGQLLDDLQNPTQPTFTDPITLEALDWYANLFLIHKVALSPSEAQRQFQSNRYVYYQMVQAGNAAMWILPISNRGGIFWPEPWDFNWGMAPLPRDAFSFNLVWVDEVYAISAETNHPQETWEWVSYLSQQIHNRKIPARTSQIESDELVDFTGEDAAELIRSTVEFAQPVSIWLFIDFDEAMEIFSAAVEKIIEGELTPAEAMEEAQFQALEGLRVQNENQP